MVSGWYRIPLYTKCLRTAIRAEWVPKTLRASHGAGLVERYDGHATDRRRCARWQKRARNRSDRSRAWHQQLSVLSEWRARRVVVECPLKNQVRTRLAAGGRRIRTRGPTANGTAVGNPARLSCIVVEPPPAVGALGSSTRTSSRGRSRECSRTEAINITLSYRSSG
jgi:hypothetical protein